MRPADIASRPRPDRQRLPAFTALGQLRNALPALGSAIDWGPGGSVAFELVTGVDTVTSASDLDLIVVAPEPLASGAAVALREAAAGAAAAAATRVDIHPLFSAPRRPCSAKTPGSSTPPSTTASPPGDGCRARLLPGASTLLASRSAARAPNLVGWTAYLGTAPGADAVPPYASPSRREDLRAAGVDCELVVVPGAPHAFESLGAGTQLAKDYTAAAEAWLRDRLVD